MKASVLVGVALAVATIASRSDAGAAGQTAPPPEVLERADAYLTSQVGELYATKNYAFVPDVCVARIRDHNVTVELDCGRVASNGASIEGYILVYEYRPWVKIGALDPRVSVRVPVPSGVTTGYIGTFDSAGRIVEPRVTRPEAEAKMRAAVPDSMLQAPLALVVPGSDRNANPVWRGWFPIAENPTSQVSRGVIVDAVTGEVTIEPDSTLSAH